MINDNIRYWLWLWYPIVVLIMVIFSIRLMFSNEVNRLAEANIKKKAVAEESQKIAGLKTKVDYLSSLEANKQIDELKKMLAAVPASKKPWLTLAEINYAASSAGIAVSDFYGSIGEIKEASEAATKEISELYIQSKVSVADFSIMRKFFEELYKFKPLINVLAFDWTGRDLVVNIEVIYRSWPKLLPDTEKIFEIDRNKQREIEDKLTNFTDVDDLVVYQATEGAELIGEDLGPF